MQAVDEIVPSLLNALERDETSATALDGLKQILRLVDHFLFENTSGRNDSFSFMDIILIDQRTNCCCSSPYIAQAG